MTPFNLHQSIIDVLNPNVVAIISEIYALKSCYPILEIELPGFIYDADGMAVRISHYMPEHMHDAIITRRDIDMYVIFSVDIYAKRGEILVNYKKSTNYGSGTILLNCIGNPNIKQIHEISSFLKKERLIEIIET